MIMQKNNVNKVLKSLLVAILIIIPFAFSGCKITNTESNGYLVKFMDGNSVVCIQTVENVESIELPTEPTKNGYVSTGWYAYFGKQKIDFDTIKETTSLHQTNLTFFAEWINKTTKFKLNYNLNGGENNVNNVIEYTVETGIVTLKEPTKKGYEFVGWYENSDFNGEKLTEINCMNAKDYDLYANWEIEYYEIKYNLNGGICESALKKFTVLDEIYFEKPSKIGYDFLGWFDSQNNQIDKIEKGTVGAISLYAKWEIHHYEIYYDLNQYKNCGVELDVDKYTILTKSIKLPQISIDGYKFWGWSFSQNADKDDAFTELTISNLTNVTLYPVVSKLYTLTLNMGDAGVETLQYYVGQQYNLTNIKTVGYKIYGWLDNGVKVQSCGVWNFAENKCFDADLYKTYELKKVVSAESIETSIFTIKDLPFTISYNDIKGYNFKGWFDNADYQGEPIYEITEVADYVIYPKYELIYYDLVLYLSDNEIMNYSVNSYCINDNIELPIPNLDGYEFKGWYLNGEFTGSPITLITPNTFYSILNLYAKWVEVLNLNVYDLTMYPNESFNLVVDCVERELKFISSDESVATVSSNGEIVAHKDGQATIIVSTENGAVAQCVVMVKPHFINFEIVKTTLYVTQKTSIINIEKSRGELIFTSSDTSIVTISGDGVIEAIFEGEAYIQGTLSDGTNKKVKVIVKSNFISINNSYVYLDGGKSFALKVTTSINDTISYKSSNTSIATVSSSGVITARYTNGRATITISSINCGSVTCTVKVSYTPYVPKTISINYANVTDYFNISVSTAKETTKNILGTVYTNWVARISITIKSKYKVVEDVSIKLCWKGKANYIGFTEWIAVRISKDSTSSSGYKILSYTPINMSPDRYSIGGCSGSVYG